MKSSEMQWLVDQFYRSHTVLIGLVQAGKYAKYSANWLREDVRCRTGASFSNSLSPTILRLMIRGHPEAGPYIDLGTLKE